MREGGRVALATAAGLTPVVVLGMIFIGPAGVVEALGFMVIATGLLLGSIGLANYVYTRLGD